MPTAACLAPGLVLVSASEWNPLYQMFSDYSLSSSTYSFKTASGSPIAIISIVNPSVAASRVSRATIFLRPTVNFIPTKPVPYRPPVFYFPGHSEWGNQCRSISITSFSPGASLCVNSELVLSSVKSAAAFLHCPLMAARRRLSSLHSLSFFQSKL
jgi:hypothetical protein